MASIFAVFFERIQEGRVLIKARDEPQAATFVEDNTDAIDLSTLSDGKFVIKSVLSLAHWTDYNLDATSEEEADNVTRVYLLSESDFESYTLHGVFPSLKQAKAARPDTTWTRSDPLTDGATRAWRANDYSWQLIEEHILTQDELDQDEEEN